eukprot:876177-Prymnesium_polylepis.1
MSTAASSSGTHCRIPTASLDCMSPSIWLNDLRCDSCDELPDGRSVESSATARSIDSAPAASFLLASSALRSTSTAIAWWNGESVVSVFFLHRRASFCAVSAPVSEFPLLSLLSMKGSFLSFSRSLAGSLPSASGLAASAAGAFAGAFAGA